MAGYEDSFDSEVSSLYQSGDEIHCFLSRKSESTSIESMSISSTEDNTVIPIAASSKNRVSVEIPEEHNGQQIGKGFTYKGYEEKLLRVKKTFVETKAYSVVKTCLGKHGKVLITGAPGEGKTATALMLCDWYRNQGYDVCECNTSPELGKCILSGLLKEKQVVHHFENIFSRENSKRLEQGQKNFKQIFPQNRPNCIIIFTSQLYDYKRDDSWMGVLLKGFSVDITSIHLQNEFNMAERFKILRRFPTKLLSKDIEKISEQEPFIIGFPEICRQFSSQEWMIKDPMHFFRYPHSYLSSKIGDIIAEDSLATNTFILLLLSNGKIKLKDFFDESTNPLFLDCWKTMKEIFPNVEKSQIFFQFQHFYGTLLKEENGTVSFTSEVVYDACVFELDRRYPGRFWEYYVMHSQDSPVYPCPSIFLSEVNTHCILQSLAASVKEGCFSKPLAHPAMKSTEHVGIFWNNIEDDLSDIVHICDATEGGNFLYWVVVSTNQYLINKLLKSRKVEVRDILCTIHYCCRFYLNASLNTVLSHIKEHDDLRSKFDINCREPGDQTLLMKAAALSDEKIIETLLEHGSDPTLVDVNKHTCLHVACVYGNVAVVKKLLLNGTVDINASDFNGMTSMMLAAERGHVDVVECFEGTNCVYTHQARNRNNILHMACLLGDLKLVKLALAKSLGLNNRGEANRSPAMIAVMYNHLHILKHLCNEKCSLSETDSSGMNVLHLACLVGDTEIVKYLISTNLIDINCKTTDGFTPLEIAKRKKRITVQEFLSSKLRTIVYV